jgi:hypothetical protein
MEINMPCYAWQTTNRAWKESGVVKYPTKDRAEQELARLYPHDEISLHEISEDEADAIVAGDGDWLA